MNERFVGIDRAHGDEASVMLIFERLSGNPPKIRVINRRMIFGARGLLRLGLITRKQYLKRKKRARSRFRRTAIDRGIIEAERKFFRKHHDPK
jgi:hypothetical protein